MRNGDRSNLITIQQEGETGRDRLNVPMTGWTTWRQVWAGIIPQRGGEKVSEAGQRFSQTVMRFRCAFMDVKGATSKMRIEFDGQVFNIQKILPDYQRRDDCIIEAELQDGAA